MIFQKDVAARALAEDHNPKSRESGPNKRVERLKPLAGDCRVFCSYGSLPCPAAPRLGREGIRARGRTTVRETTFLRKPTRNGIEGTSCGRVGRLVASPLVRL